MANIRIGENMEIIRNACSVATRAQELPNSPYVSLSVPGGAFFGFSGSYAANDWFSRGPFGDVEVDPQLFPSLKSVGLDERGRVNEAFLLRFQNTVLAHPQFINEVEIALAGGKQVVFTGHSLGGAIAILSTIWFLEKYFRPRYTNLPPGCVTFGSPLVGDFIVNLALGRENWSRFFLHFVTRYDIVPRISLTPQSSIEQQLQTVLNYLNPGRTLYRLGTLFEAAGFYRMVMKNSLLVASSAACKSMGSTNPLQESLSSFVELSPYRPVGTYIFCTGNGKYVVVSNADAVLQLLFYSAQLNSAAEVTEVAQRSLNDHLSYSIVQLQTVTYLDGRYLEILPLSANDGNAETADINIALNDLGVSAKGRLCLRAAAEMEKQKLRNQNTIDNRKREIDDQLKKIEGYKHDCEAHGVGYYDSFKVSNDKNDFHANVARLELAGIWDEIVEMLKRHELPATFEGQRERPEREWIVLGTRYRRNVEPLDIANYYRHLKNEDTGPYMENGRPKRYKCTQKWLEYAERIPNERSAGSCFWAEVEELCIKTGEAGNRDKVLRLAGKVENWIRDGELGEDVKLQNSTFARLCMNHHLTEQELGFSFWSSRND